MSSKRRSSTLQRSQSVPNIASPSKVPCVTRCRTVASPPAHSDGELDDPYALPGGQDPEKMKSPEKRPGKRTSELFSPIESFQGQNRETLDEFNYLLDGIQDTHPISVRHSSLLNLVTLLSEPHAYRLLCLNGSFQLIFPAILCNMEDSLFQVALLMTAFLATGEKANCQFLGEIGTKFLLMLATGNQVISATKIPFSSPQSTLFKIKKGRPISKRQRSGGSLGNIVRELDFFKLVDLKLWKTFTNEEVTPKNLALWTLVKGVEDSCFRSLLLQVDAPSALLPLLHCDASRLNGEERVSSPPSSSSSSSPSSPSSSSSFTASMTPQDRLKLHLSIFEHLAHDVGTHRQLLAAHESKTNASSRPLVAILLDLLQLCNQQKSGDYESYVSSILLLLVNLTNKSERGCEAVCTTKHEQNFIGVLVDLLAKARARYEKELTGMYDTITTALGVLINLVESSALSRQQLLAAQALRTENAIKFFAEWFVANDRAYQASVRKSKTFNTPDKKRSKISTCLSPLSPEAPPPFESTPPTFKRASSFATLSDNELEEESLVLENQMIACYLSVLLGFLTSNLPENRRSEVLQHLPNNAKSLTDKLKEFLVIQSDASMLMDDTLEAIMGMIETLS